MRHLTKFLRIINLIGFQFPSHRDVLCDSVSAPGMPAPELPFQFPSHRDVLCDWLRAMRFYATAPIFQFPSHRDVLCDFFLKSNASALSSSLSVPFSSGCALRPKLVMTFWINVCHFQFPSHRDVLCDRSPAGSKGCLLPGFQFPSHRDVLCDLYDGPWDHLADLAFSSLLIGMCFAT